MKQEMMPMQFIEHIKNLSSQRNQFLKDIEKMKVVVAKLDARMDQDLSNYEQKAAEKKIAVGGHSKAKHKYKYHDIPDYSNRIALKAITDIAPKFDYSELELILSPSEINPWAKTLNVILKKSDINNSGFIDPEVRYFTKAPIKSKDGIEFYVTTQWDVDHKRRIGIIPGSFKRLIEVLAAHRINILQNN